MRRPALPLAIFVVFVSWGAAACGPSTAPVSSTTTGHNKKGHAPPAPDKSVADTTGETPLPKSEDAAERVAFSKAGSIYLMNATGGDQRRLTYKASNAPDEAPALSPHGDAVAFMSRRDGVSKLYVVALDGAGTRQVTDGADGGDLDPSWAPDGRKLVFVRGKDRRDLYVVDFDGGGAPKKILAGADDDVAFAGGPSWSPDGAEIAFSGDRGEGMGTGLWLVKPDGTGLRRLTRPTTSERWYRDVHASWSPDGKKIVFASNRHATSESDSADLDLYEVTVEDGTITRLTRDSGVADDPSYSPDGKRIFFSSTREAVRPYAIELFAMPAGGGEQRRLTRDEVPQNAAPSAGRVP